MSKRSIIIVFLICSIVILCGVTNVNIVLNRSVYSDILLSFKDNEDSYLSNERTNIDYWNLDYMEKVLANADNYKKNKEDILQHSDINNNMPTEVIDILGENISTLSFDAVPKIRILFNKNPFDLRIATDRFTFAFNKKSVERLISLEKLKKN
ncbi:hypothetical protein [Clostridium grantii]|uniref:Uncharacterized protein n=1 Tax=Clostridium grantii DSM 8605 TaxID=1121316 RepID=A0A1M5XKG0_9CLOT|nr:hypothetical protein [Clostridium grantii]SHI00310.1 hypothetical protein SAMN02745207_03737 [Clostridium grantii DSM 8605]